MSSVPRPISNDRCEARCGSGICISGSGKRTCCNYTRTRQSDGSKGRVVPFRNCRLCTSCSPRPMASKTTSSAQRPSLAKLAYSTVEIVIRASIVSRRFPADIAGRSPISAPCSTPLIWLACARPECRTNESRCLGSIGKCAPGRFETPQARAEAIGGPQPVPEMKRHKLRETIRRITAKPRPPTVTGNRVLAGGGIASGSSPTLVQLVGNDWFRRNPVTLMRRGEGPLTTQS